MELTASPGGQAHTLWCLLAISPDWRAHFLNQWQRWRSDPQRPARLHVVALAETSASTPTAASPDASDLAEAIERVCRGLVPGEHRFVFEAGRVQLTLCIGPLAARLRELDGQFDAIEWTLPPAQPTVDPALLKGLGRVSRRGTQLTVAGADAPLGELLRPCGYEPAEAALSGPPHVVQAVFQPGWTPRHRPRTAHSLSRQGHCVVLGGGLAGAAVAASLARRGWQVQVLDAGERMGAGASGLPAGLAVPHVTPDDNPLSRIIRAGLRATTQRCAELLREGRDWQASGVLEHCVGNKRRLPENWATAGHDWSTPASAAQRAQAGLAPDTPALWHGMALWMRPLALVQAQLQLPGVQWQGGIHVHKMRRQADQWQLLDAQDRCVAEAALVVVAAGHPTRALLEQAWRDQGLAPAFPLNPLRGQMSWGRLDTLDEATRSVLPPFPVNGSGSFIHGLPCPDDTPSAGHAGWFCGSTFERTGQGPLAKPEDHSANLARLQSLLPTLAGHMQAHLAPPRVQAWAGLRCTLPDHRPAVGPVDDARLPGLWTCTGLGTRGLSVSVLCGELVAAWLHGEPLPLEAELAHKIAAGRFRASVEPAHA